MRAITNLWVISLLLLGLGLWLSWKQLNPNPPEIQVWLNGHIVTADADNRVVNALAVQKNQIVAVGNASDMEPWIKKGAAVTDLQGKAILPGFVEAHGHFPGVGLYALFADLNAPPIADVNNIATLLNKLRHKADNTPAGKPIVGMGYDDTLMAEKRHPSREELDSVSTEHPIYIIHVSGHMGVLNSTALKAEGINKNTPQPEGGEIKHRANGELSGLLTETAFLPLFKKLTHFNKLDQLRVSLAGVKLYAAQGYTTTQNGLATKSHISGLKLGSKIGLVPQRVVLWPDQQQALPDLREDKALAEGDDNKVFVGAIKFQADGSIQGYTGHLSQPYHVIGHGHQTGYSGFPAIPKEQLASLVTEAQCAGKQTAIHGNGDATIDNILYAWEQAQAACPAKDLRHVLIHAQTIRSDQLQRMAALNAASGLNISPSFHIVHPYYWGDRHKSLFLGPDRAQGISPTQETLANGLRFSTHLDAPVVPVTSMLRMWAPVSRQTHGGETLGKEQAINVMQSIRAMTIDAAWQMHLDKKLGSIEVGKFADLVVLNKNPLSMPLAELRNIHVLQTLVGGVSIYQRPQ